MTLTPDSRNYPRASGSRRTKRRTRWRSSGSSSSCGNRSGRRNRKGSTTRRLRTREGTRMSMRRRERKRRGRRGRVNSLARKKSSRRARRSRAYVADSLRCQTRATEKLTPAVSFHLLFVDPETGFAASEKKGSAVVAHCRSARQPCRTRREDRSGKVKPEERGQQVWFLIVTVDSRTLESYTLSSFAMRQTRRIVAGEQGRREHRVHRRQSGNRFPIVRARFESHSVPAPLVHSDGVEIARGQTINGFELGFFSLSVRDRFMTRETWRGRWSSRSGGRGRRRCRAVRMRHRRRRGDGNVSCNFRGMSRWQRRCSRRRRRVEIESGRRQRRYGRRRRGRSRFDRDWSSRRTIDEFDRDRQRREIVRDATDAASRCYESACGGGTIRRQASSLDREAQNVGYGKIRCPERDSEMRGLRSMHRPLNDLHKADRGICAHEFDIAPVVDFPTSSVTDRHSFGVSSEGVHRGRSRHNHVLCVR